MVGVGRFERPTPCTQDRGWLLWSSDAPFGQNGGDGNARDAASRLYVTVGGANPGIDVISPEGKELGLIPTPLGVITVTFSGTDRKTLYAVSNDPKKITSRRSR